MCAASCRTGCSLRGVYTFASNLDDGSAWNTSVSANTPAFVMYPGNPRLDYGPAATNIRHAGAINGTWELPFSHGLLANPVAKQLVGGWSLSGIATLQSGFPFSPQLGYNPTGNGDTRNPVRPNRAPGFQWAALCEDGASNGSILLPLPRPYPGPSATSAGTRSPARGLRNWTFPLAKSTTIHERLRAQFRAEFFNVLNHSNFTTPNAVVYSSGPTPKTPTAEAAAVADGRRYQRYGDDVAADPVWVEAAFLEGSLLIGAGVWSC